MSEECHQRTNLLGRFKHDKACLWKLLIELISCPFITVEWNKKGLTIREPVFASGVDVVEMLIQARCKAKYFGEYVCKQNFICKLPTRQHRDCLKAAAKKKARIGIEVWATKEPHILTMDIVIKGADGTAGSVEKHTMICNLVEPSSPIEYPDDSLYRPEISVESPNLARIRGFASNNRERSFVIKTQVAKGYFSVGTISPGLPGSSKELGEPVDHYPVFATDSEGWVVCGKCKEYIADCSCLCELCEYPRAECECACDFCNQYLQDCDCHVYEKTERRYPFSAILRLTKTQSFKFPIKFSESKNLDLPLRVKFTVIFGGSVLGDVLMYVRDSETIKKEIKKSKKTPSRPAKAKIVKK